MQSAKIVGLGFFKKLIVKTNFLAMYPKTDGLG
jgi:hypothetical protein